jgi:SIR2-like domain
MTDIIELYLSFGFCAGWEGIAPSANGFCWRLYSNFEPNRIKDIGIYLYKLHGSIDWERAVDKGNVLVKLTHPKPESELIFGTDAKLTSTDPYLYDVFEFRKYSLHEDCKLIIVIGYSFGDDYMNKLIAQALTASQQRNVLIVDLKPKGLKTNFVAKYAVNESQVKIWEGSAADFLKEQLSLTFLADYLPSSDETPF